MNINRIAIKEIETNKPNLHRSKLKGITRDEMISAIQKQKNITVDILKAASDEIRYPQFLRAPKGESFSSKRNVRVFHNFIPNLMSSIFTALGYFDEGHQPEMIWDCYLLLNIYYKIFTIPVLITFALGSVVASTGVAALTAAAVSLVGLAALYTYARWFRGFPSKMTHGIVRIGKGQNEPIVGRDAEVREILKFHSDHPSLTKKHILVIGEPGTGKTTTLQKAAIELQKQSSRIAVYDASRAPFDSSDKWNKGPVNLIEDGLNQLGSLESRSVFILNELLSTVVTDSSKIKPDVAGKLRDLLDNRTAAIWATGTIKDLEALKNADKKDGLDQAKSLLQRFHVIDFRKYPVSDELMSAMVASYLLFHKEFIICDPGIPQAAIKLAKENFPDDSQPRAACMLINRSMATVKANLNSLALSTPELKKAHEILAARVASYRLSDRSSTASLALKQSIEDLHQKVESIEKSLEKKHLLVKKVKGLCHSILEDHQKLYDYAKKIQSKKGNSFYEKEFLYLKYWRLPGKYKKILEYEKLIGPGCPVRVTEDVLKEQCS